MCHGPVFDLNDAQFLKLVAESKTLNEIASKIGIKSTKGIQTRLKTVPLESRSHLGLLHSSLISASRIIPKIKIQLKSQSRLSA